MFKNLTWKTWAGAEKASLRPGREPGKCEGPGQEDAKRPKSEEQGAENTSGRKGQQVVQRQT